MTTSNSPYQIPEVSTFDTSTTAGVVEVEIKADETLLVDIGDGHGLATNVQTFNGFIPGPTFRLNVGDTVIVRLINRLAQPCGIHWHGIELENSADGTPFTQNMVPGQNPMWPPGGGTFLYKFKVTRPGLYWYHPHHHVSTNQVFRGLYGMIIVTDPNEAALITAGVLPDAAETIALVLSDTTVCKAPGSNDPETYDPTLGLPWTGPGGIFNTAQPVPTPVALCETSPLDDEGMTGAPPFGVGDIPNIQKMTAGRTNEGQTVLTNGMNVGARGGSPIVPVALVGGWRRNVSSGQGLRLQIVNSAALRYFRLVLTDNNGNVVPLVRIGGEGGLLNAAVVEGGVIGGFDTGYASGEILLAPGNRADVVVAIPPAPIVVVGDVLTLWTQDYPRVGLGNHYSGIPSVPVMHLEVTGTAGTTYTIGNATALASTGTPVVPLGVASAVLLDPVVDFATPKRGLSTVSNPANADATVLSANIQDIVLTTGPGIGGVAGTHDESVVYTAAPHFDSTRYAQVGLGNILQLTVTNSTAAHHPFHLHGFSMQPISLTHPTLAAFTWPYTEFRDVVDVPPGYTLTFRIRVDDRPLEDGVTLGGALGRWMFHCHLIFHAHLGMTGELIMTAAGGNEKPNVNVAGSWAYAPAGGIAQRQGTFSDPDGDAVTLTATLGTGASFGTLTPGAGTWLWTSVDPISTIPIGVGVYYVYVTATDSGGLQDQTVFRVKIGAPDDGADNGDPHISTVDGKYYDFQAVGEFTLLRDAEGLEIQARQTPVPTANPVLDSHSGLRSCVSINTAIAARVGAHQISYQPGYGDNRRLQFFLDGKPAKLSARGIDLGSDRVVGFSVGNGVTALRVDYANGAVLTVTPNFWTSNNVWYLNVAVSHTIADEGIMGRIAKNNWLPALPNGAMLGPRPASLHDRHVTLYQTFANAWRVTDKTSLFVYAPGTSTVTFTDPDWPAEKPPCRLKPQFKIPGAKPILVNIPLATAKRICRPVKIGHLNRGCVFDVATTGDKTLVKGYLLAQDLKLNGSSVQIVGDKARTRQGESVLFTASVLPLTKRGPTPTGSVRFWIDGVATGGSVPLDKRGRAFLKTGSLPAGAHWIRVKYTPGGKKRSYHPCTSPNLLHMVQKKGRTKKYAEPRAAK